MTEERQQKQHHKDGDYLKVGFYHLIISLMNHISYVDIFSFFFKYDFIFIYLFLFFLNYIFNQHFRFDLTNFQEHDTACELYKRAIKVPGENIWNIKINGIHFDPLLDLDYNGKFVKFGIIDFEYIITKNKFDMEYFYYLLLIIIIIYV